MLGLNELLTAADRFFELQEAPDVALCVDLVEPGVRIWAVDDRGANWARVYTSELVADGTAMGHQVFFGRELERAALGAAELEPLDRDTRAYWVWYAERQLSHSKEPPRLQHQLRQRP
jgi:hypothetical protein